MENLSIKILDVLYDLCEGENYVILDKEDIIASFTDHVFETDELTEILESLTVEGFIELKYADNTEYCIAMRMKGRALIKQTREKLAQFARDNGGSDAVIEGHTVTVDDIPESYRDEPTIPEPRVEHHRQEMPVEAVMPTDGNFADRGRLSRGYTNTDERDEAEKNAKRRERRVFLAAMIGAAVGSIVMDLIFLVVFLLKLRG